MTMNAIASYFDYVKLMSHEDNDFVYLLSIATPATILQGNYQSLQSPDLSDKLVVQGGTFDIVLNFYDTFDPVNYPTWRSLNRALVFGFIGHTFTGQNAQCVIEWFADNENPNTGVPYVSHTYNFAVHEDTYLDKMFGANDFLVIDDSTGTGFEQLSGETITAIKLSFTNTTGADMGIGRLWVGNNFQQKNDISQDQVFDGGWSMGFQSIGSFDRNFDNSTGYSKAANVQRQISVGKSLMPFSMAYGKLYSDSNNPNRNTTTDSYSNMIRTVHKFDDVIIIPDYEDNISVKHTAVYGTIINNPKITKDSKSNLYSCQIDVLEIVEDQGSY